MAGHWWMLRLRQTFTRMGRASIRESLGQRRGGWGVHVVNSDKFGDYYGALPGSTQTNSRVELVALDAALQLAWLSPHQHFRIFTDCEYAEKGIK